MGHYHVDVTYHDGNSSSLSFLHLSDDDAINDVKKLMKDNADFVKAKYALPGTKIRAACLYSVSGVGIDCAVETGIAVINCDEDGEIQCYRC